MPDINTRLEKFYAKHPDARPSDSAVSLHCIDGDWYWCVPGESDDMSDANVVRMAICPDALRSSALVRWLSRNNAEPRILDSEDSGEAVVEVYRRRFLIRQTFAAPTLLEALFAAAEAVGVRGEGDRATQREVPVQVAGPPRRGGPVRATESAVSMAVRVRGSTVLV